MSDDFKVQINLKDYLTPGDLVNVRGATVEEVFQAASALGAYRADLQQALNGGAEAAVAAQLGGTVLQHPTATAPAGFANVAQPLTPVPVQPQGITLPVNLTKYNTLIPGLPTQACKECGAAAYPCNFTSKAGKAFKKYKCGANDKHDNDWIN